MAFLISMNYNSLSFSLSLYIYTFWQEAKLLHLFPHPFWSLENLEKFSKDHIDRSH